MPISNSDYVVGGNFEIKAENDITKIILSESFTAAGLPDLVIYLSNSTDSQDGALLISEDIGDNGAHEFTIPDNVNVDDYSTVLLFCRDFNEKVGFGVIN